jgi:RNA polymerase sigma-70 factor, ECF subfamily
LAGREIDTLPAMNRRMRRRGQGPSAAAPAQGKADAHVNRSPKRGKTTLHQKEKENESATKNQKENESATKKRHGGDGRSAPSADLSQTGSTSRTRGNSNRNNLTWAREAILAEVPKLRGFAISLCGNIDQADDFVQETLLRAWAHIDQFHRGTNMGAWLFTILRNSLRSNYRKYRREVEDVDGGYAERLVTHPEQNGRLEFEELREALARLPADQRDTLVLVVASGASYEEAAEICGCRVGTVKSRVHRARARLAQLLGIESLDDIGPDRTTQAVVSSEALGPH